MNTTCIVYLIVALLTSTEAFAWTEKGLASYYGKKFHGRRTASGERYNNDSLTCAHRTHPFGTILEVYNVRNQQKIAVRVNDRGPFVRNRIIDVSYKAAELLGFILQGITPVQIRVYKPFNTIPLPIPKQVLKIQPITHNITLSISEQVPQKPEQ